MEENGETNQKHPTDPWVEAAQVEHDAYQEMYEFEKARAAAGGKYAKSPEKLQELAEVVNYKKGIAEYRQIATENTNPIQSVDADNKLL
jgi:hypothetical protein